MIVLGRPFQLNLMGAVAYLSEEPFRCLT